MAVEINIQKRERTIINPFTGQKVDGLTKGLGDSGITQEDIDNKAQSELIKHFNEPKQ